MTKDQAAWNIAPLGEVTEINPRRPSELSRMDPTTPVSFVPMAAVSEVEGQIVTPEVRAISEVSKGFTYFAEGDVIFAKITPCMQNGKSAIATGLSSGLGFGSTEFHVLRPTAKVTAEWIHLFVRQRSFRDLAASHFRGSAGQQRVPADFLEKYPVPIPSIEEQRRISGRIHECILRVREVERLRDQLWAEAGACLPSYLRETYTALCHDYPTVPLHSVVDVLGGGTPSKSNESFWAGDIPWVSPKDMKVREIDNTADHVSREAVERSAAKLILPPAVLFVVRGMILAHTLPVAVSRVPLTINQDMKALQPKPGNSAEFLAFMIRGAAPDLLAQVEIAGHGTRRLQTEKWCNLPIPVLPEQNMKKVMDSLSEAQAAVDEARDEANHQLPALLGESILRQAFAGEL